MNQTTKQKGDEGEFIAINYLQKNNYHIKDTNFKFGRFWEVDIIAFKDWITIFLEVKYRHSIKFWTPEESITKFKLFRFRKTIEYYVVKNHLNFEKIRFDVITILYQEKRNKCIHTKSWR